MAFKVKKHFDLHRFVSFSLLFPIVVFIAQLQFCSTDLASTVNTFIKLFIMTQRSARAETM